MPIYEYACGKCGSEFEVEQRITDDPVRTCPSCRSRKVKRLISQTSFVLKGSGWYSDLYSSKSGKAGEADAAPGDSKGDAKGDSKGDAKDDAKQKAAKGSDKKGSKKSSPKAAA